MSLTRRAFLAASGTVFALPRVAGAAAALVGSSRDATLPTDGAPLPTAVAAPPAAVAGLNEPQPWYAAMRRCGQLNLNERDPLTLDVDAWMTYWTSLRVDALLINGGGIVAFYPTEIPYHHRSQYLGSRDVFGELVRAARSHGVRLVARMDCNYAYEEALQAHPDWFERDREGRPRPHGEATWLFKTCMFSPYFSEQMPAIYREINRRYQVDGFFTNGWPSTGALTVCYCGSCREVFRARVGGEPPAQTDAGNPLYRRYYDAYMDRVLTIWKQWQAVAVEGNARSVYVGNLGGGIRTVKNVRTLAEVAHWFNADHQGRAGDTPIWDCAQQGRVAQAVMHGRPITNVAGAYSNSRPTWRHVSKPPPETTMWLAQTTASGMVPWFHWLGGSPEDTRWQGPGRQFFQWLARHDAHFRNRRSVADVAVVYPQRTIAFYQTGRRGSAPAASSGPRPDSTEWLQGLYYALLEGRFLFDFVHEDDLREEALRGYRALVMPNVAYLEDEACRAVRRFVAGGGSLVATFETSRYTGWGDPRPDFALADVFGASVAGEAIGPVGNSYMRIERPHPVTRGFEGTSLLPGPEHRVPVKANEAASGEAVGAGTVMLRAVPSYPAFPPEMVYPRVEASSEPAVILRERAGPAGRVVYFAGDVDRTLWRSGSADLSVLMQNAIRWAMGDARPAVTIDGDGLIEAFAWETEGGYALHLLNYTNPNLTHGFIRRFYPIGRQRVAFELRPGERLSNATMLRAEQPLRFTQTDGTVQFDVPSVVDYEVAALTVQGRRRSG